MGKKTEKARREELKDMSLFRLKRVAAQAGADAEKVRSCEAKSEVIELIIEKEFGEEEPKRAKVKKEESVKDKNKKGKKDDDEDEDDPKENDEEEKPKKGKKKDEDEDDGDDDDDDGDGDGDDDDDDDGDDDGNDDDDPKEDEKPKREKVKKEDEDDRLDRLIKLVEEVKSDMEGTTRFAAGAYYILNTALPIIGKTVGTKGMTKKITAIVEKLFPKAAKDDDDDKEED